MRRRWLGFCGAIRIQSGVGAGPESSRAPSSLASISGSNVKRLSGLYLLRSRARRREAIERLVFTPEPRTTNPDVELTDVVDLGSSIRPTRQARARRSAPESAR